MGDLGVGGMAGDGGDPDPEEVCEVSVVVPGSWPGGREG